MVTNIFLILAGFLLLIQGADYLVKGAASLSRRLGVSALVVGLTVVAFGTSAPEFFVNIIAASQGVTDIAVGNILGSNLANFLLVLGATAIIVPLKLGSGTVWKEIPFSVLAAAMVLIFGSDMLLEGRLPNEIGRIEGLALLAFFIIFIIYTFGIRETGERPEEKIEQFGISKSTLYTLGGLVALVLGGHVLVNGATALAESFGVSQNLIALTIVALGTSLPELVTAIVAARKGHIDIAIGGVVGSNIFNVLFILASSAIIYPLTFARANITDAIAALVATVFLFMFMFLGKKQTLERWQGAFFVIMYFSYMTFVIFRG